MARYQYRRILAVQKTRVALPDLSVSSVPHKTVAYFGYEFELPWDDVDEQKSRTAETVHVHVTPFHSGNAASAEWAEPPTKSTAPSRSAK